jgi:hypothetical protein
MKRIFLAGKEGADGISFGDILQAAVPLHSNRPVTAA